MYEDAARAWNATHQDAPVSVFACQYPGKYREAADALRRVRRQLPGSTAPERGEGDQDQEPREPRPVAASVTDPASGDLFGEEVE